MFKYRLYTEDFDRKRLAELFHEYPSYTVYNATGVWKGATECSIIIEILDDSLGVLSDLKQIADIIKQENKQQAVLVTRSEVEAKLF